MASRILHLTNSYAVKKYGVKNDIQLIDNLRNEKIYSLYPFEADEFVATAVEACLKELLALEEGRHYVDAYERAWLNKPYSLLTTTQNTKDLGGYRTKNGTLTKDEIILRSDVQ